ncbi:AAA family ATPase [Exiguobacterium sp. s192]|uniref:AAA family ATPase n=1 Tax=Exiguobacterium sp. s192 TaxID=2751206 RepID=UPI001BED2013|nr:AAA family ATPase [Exiguobacterium sp. s192]
MKYVENLVVKLKQIKINNIKNVKSGEINLKDNRVLGIYGQNGSGKTALVDSLIILKTLISGERMKSNILDLIDDENKLKVSIVLEVLDERDIFYSFSLRKVMNSEKIKVSDITHNEDEKLTLIDSSNESESIKLEVFEETLETLSIEKIRKKTLMSFSADNEIYPLATKNIFPDNKLNTVKLDYVKTMAKENQESFIFGKGMQKFIAEQSDKEIVNELRRCMYILNQVLAVNLSIHSNSQFGIIYSNTAIPISYFIKVDSKLSAHGILNLSSEKAAILKAVEFHYATVVFDQINGVLPHIIPGLKVELNTLETTKTEEGMIEEYVVELISNRDGKKLPFRSESDGIKKIVSVLSNIISAYNNPNNIAIIDELDSGIYEFLLGEILEIFSESAEGTLIFTSHNLRALEVLKPSEIVFTTTNPMNRYINIPDVKITNNLRSKYIRAIQLGGYSEELYEPTNKFEIKNSMKSTHRKILRRFEKIKNGRA